jgi:hypothetical protein
MLLPFEPLQQTEMIQSYASLSPIYNMYGLPTSIVACLVEFLETTNVQGSATTSDLVIVVVTFTALVEIIVIFSGFLQHRSC